MRSIYRFKYLPLLLVIIVAGALFSCKTSETAREDEPTTAVRDSISLGEGQGLNLAAYRSSLSDLYTTQHHDMLEFFMQSNNDAQSGNRDPYDGFRIQVVSTRNVALADSIARSFRVWSDTTIAQYTPEAYVFFKQPHYKVHVGDFSNRDRAIQFSKLVKRRYPDAWVVHDRINPYLVPSDTVQISLKSDIEKKEKSMQ
ncbi:MAG: SPOR domain-containing protein [Balneolaceae bacterium]|nr:SPOR domain-containing protein [Balneolaceae bacterium]